MSFVTDPLSVIGAGIGGLAAALLLARAGRAVEVWEQAPAPAPVGAGIQLGPNATRLLASWGMGDALRRVACVPEGVQVRSARTGRVIAQRGLQASDAPWLCVHRAELHALLLRAAEAAGAQVRWGKAFELAEISPHAPLIAADGAWSAVRAASGDSSLPQPTGHWAWRCLLEMHALPREWRTPLVQPWWGSRQHVVTYPVRLGQRQMLNVVAFTPMPAQSSASQERHWAQPASASELLQALGDVCSPLAAAIGIGTKVTRWPVVARAPLTGASAMLCQLQGRSVPLLGDAAHPMRPYIAQGAAMALEDAAVLAACLQREADWSSAVQRYANARWARNAMLQARSERNGRIFHMPPPLSWARNMALRLHPALMDSPQVYDADVLAELQPRAA